MSTNEAMAKLLAARQPDHRVSQNTGEALNRHERHGVPSRYNKIYLLAIAPFVPITFIVSCRRKRQRGELLFVGIVGEMPPYIGRHAASLLFISRQSTKCSPSLLNISTQPSPRRLSMPISDRGPEASQNNAEKVSRISPRRIGDTMGMAF